MPVSAYYKKVEKIFRVVQGSLEPRTSEYLVYGPKNYSHLYIVKEEDPRTSAEHWKAAEQQDPKKIL